MDEDEKKSRPTRTTREYYYNDIVKFSIVCLRVADERLHDIVRMGHKNNPYYAAGSAADDGGGHRHTSDTKKHNPVLIVYSLRQQTFCFSIRSPSVGIISEQYPVEFSWVNWIAQEIGYMSSSTPKLFTVRWFS